MEKIFNYIEENNFRKTKAFFEDSLNQKKYLNVKDASGMTPLIVASWLNNTKIVLLLAKLGSNISLRDESGNTALDYAISNKNNEIIDYLLNIERKLKTKEENIIIDFLIEEEIIEKGEEIYLEEAINSQNEYGNTALMIACARKQIKIVELFIKYKANLNIQNNANDTALMIACGEKQIKMVELLIKHKASLNCQNKEGNTALMIVCGASENSQIGERRQDFSYSHDDYRKENSRDIVKLLIEQKVDLDLKNKEKDTALLIAYKEKKGQLIKLLFKAGANFRIINKDGKNLVTLAKANNDTKYLGNLIGYQSSWTYSEFILYSSSISFTIVGIIASNMVKPHPAIVWLITLLVFSASFGIMYQIFKKK